MKVALNSVHPLPPPLSLSLLSRFNAATAASQINQTNCLAMDKQGKGESSVMYSLLWQMGNWKWKMGKLAIGEYRAKTRGDWWVKGKGAGGQRERRAWRGSRVFWPQPSNVICKNICFQ